MAERGEGTGTLGGSHSRTTTAPTLSSGTRTRNNQVVEFVVEGVGGGPSNILPLRKRKFAFSEVVKRQSRNETHNLETDFNIDTTNLRANSPSSSCSSSYKRRRIISGDSETELKETLVEDCVSSRKSCYSPSVKRQKRDSDHRGKLSSPTLATQSPPTPSKHSGVVRSSPGQRRSSRGSYPIGFYAEEEQKSLAAFRDRTSELKSKGQEPELIFCAGEVDTKRSFRASSKQESKGVQLQQRQFHLYRSDTGSKKSRSRKKKMTENKPSWNVIEGKSYEKVKEYQDLDPICVETTKILKQKASRRHTLPGRPDPNIAMGLTLTKCLAAKAHDNDQFSSTDEDSPEPKPSTSGVVTSFELSNGNNTPKMLDQIMKRLPRKKKSSSEQDLSQVNTEIPSSSEVKHGERNISAILRRNEEVKRRKSTNLENSSKKESYLSKEKLESCHVDEMRNNSERNHGGVLKSYPLRNRLRLSEGGGVISGATNNSSNNLSPILGGHMSANGTTAPVGSSPSHPSPIPPQITDPVVGHNQNHLSHSTPSPQSYSLPSSPSSPGVAFLDTFRRLRESRRLSHEQSQSSSNSKKGIQGKEGKQSSFLPCVSSSWKRGHGVRKSPIASKRGSRGKVINTNSSTNSRSSGGVCGGGSQGPLHIGSTAPPLSVPPTALGVLTTSASNSAGLLPASLPALGAIGNNGMGMNGGGTSGSSFNPGSNLGGALGGLMGAPGDSESEENEMGRLEALLASRGLPPSLFGALGPRMQHILHRSVSSSISSKAQQLLVGLQATGDEGEQLQAVIEMCQLLVMGNEDTLTGFPIKQVTPALINLLNMDHNFDMMNHACRALTYMMEALPRSSAVVVDAVPVFLEKLQVIQCMDVAEQSLTALNMLSRKHSKAILQAHGVSACLTYIDFFSSNAQRAALSITANCFQNLTADEFHFASDALPILSSRLTTQGDKKCVESVCHAYSRLVDCFQNDPNRLQEIASHGLLNNIQQLLVMSPPVLSSGTFIMVIRMLSLMCSNCPELAVTLLKNNIAQTLCYLLTNSTEPPPEQVELVPRSPQELYEITCLIGELMPVLPSDGIFVVDSALQRPTVSSHEMLTWQWQDERGQWHNYTPTDSRVIELAHQSGEDEISLCVNGITYTLDFHSMQQINDNTGTIRSILRRMVPAGSNANVNVQIQSTDARSKCLKEDEELASTLIKSLFSLLYEVYSSSAGPAVRYKCLRALLRMVHFSSPDLLQQVLKSQDVSSHLATMLSSLDLKIIVGALQMADLLMQKLPQIFAIYFRREGVMHQIKRLCKPDALASTSPVTVPLNKNSSPQIFDTSFNSMTISSGNGSPNSLSLGGGSPLLQSTARSFNGNCLDGTPPILPATAGSITASLNQEEEKLNNSSQLRLSDVLKRKRPKNTSRINVSGGGWRRGGRHEESNSSSPFSDFLIKNTGFSSTSSRDSWKGVSGSGGGRSKLLSSSSNSSTGGGSSASNSKTTSFLSNFNPVRWGRCNSSNSNPSQQDNHLMKVRKQEKIPTSISNTSSSHSPTVLIHSSSSAYSNREYIKNWIKDQAILLNERYFLTELQGCTHPALTVLNRLITAICQLDQEPDGAIPALKEISEIVSESDISPFEVIHSGLVRALLNYLTASEGAAGIPGPLSFSSSPSNILCSGEGGDNNMLGILATAASISSDSSASSAKPSNVTKVSRDKRIRNFLFVFLGCSLDPLSVSGIDADRVSAFSSLVAKLNGCVNQLEQFPVKVHDLPGTGLPGTGRGGSTSAIKFFNTHQLKCNLQRYPDCTKLRQWRGGPVKVDPLALVQAIERYLVIRGYGRLREDDEENSDDDNSDEDFDDTLAAVSVNHSTSNHKLQFLIGDQILPYNMTVYQAIRQYSSPDASTSEADTDSEMPISHSSIWLQTHTIYYRPLQEESSRSSSRKGKSGSKRSPKKKGDILFSESTIFGGSNSVLENQLLPYLPTSVTIRDPSLEVLSLLRVLYTINRYYGTLYPPAPFKAPLPMIEFVNMKLTAKANRQLQDPLVIMTGNLPQWLPQIAYACPFMFPFETRQLLFYAVSFDRDRALQRLMDSAPELNSSDSSERVTPRLERRKRTVSREDILKQAETVIGDLASSRAMLEIQYENEVGTGLGPTLEFYALVSKELQKADLELWRGDTVNVEEGNNGDVPGKVIKYINASTGLYPLPVSRSMKSGHVTKLKAKFKFLGKLMAKAVMDSRMLDLNLHECVYKWLLGEERSLGLQDVISLDPALGQTLSKLQNIVLQKKRFQEDSMISGTPVFELQQSIEALTVDGCNVEDLALNFTLPGFPNIELRKGGTDTEVTIHNIEQYLQLVVEWLIREGVWRQMEAFREGFELVFPVSQLQVFYPEELEQLFCGSVEAVPWDTKQLAECCRPDHGYTHNSKAVKFLLQILSEYTPQNQRAFLQFVTGSPRLPVGGFRSLSPPLTIVRKAFEAGENPDNFLPSVMTCVNYLKLPDYSTIEVMRAKLQLAAEEGQHSFHLS